ncbi:response regulator transcription factor [Cupriavidus pauculus]|uniref:DNA-binding response regulator n=1 Tax=Cupriavidus pauculus TaxID=82633 RepID=A0A2N5CAI1_9BURK|nr:response regulator [Cupriavidus pauculus]PLP99217.1 DNA-binding response regulator [Cupriavidus pauculus]
MQPDPDIRRLADAMETRVLVVDDSPDARGMLTRALGDEAMLVHAASSGNAALDALAFFAPDAVLLDVDMPGMDGFATCQALMDRHADLPVIFMTGLGDTGHIVRGFEVGACDYVTKPVAIAEVVARVRSHASKARLARSARDAVLGSTVPMFAAGLDGRWLWSNASATQVWLDRGWPAPVPGGGLPSALHDALQRLRLAAHVTLDGMSLRRLTGDASDWMVVELGAPTLAGEGADADAPAGAGPVLTAREAEVMAWVARGKTNRDVAEILGMSPRTVNKHLEHIYEKLGVETRTAAVAASQRRLGQSAGNG